MILKIELNCFFYSVACSIPHIIFLVRRSQILHLTTRIAISACALLINDMHLNVKQTAKAKRVYKISSQERIRP